ncbi:MULTISPECIES: cyd operon YbgE family protein [Microvirgula]|uniref:Cyd operon protein YbgE n=1 Tax=Microvirgula aerodenitrificans TaxID=57480 RepID=A0A2S0P6J7_9NEIS|nr:MULTISPECIES: cyd operon YbgE family protein [Microvirgula]AVY92962.1 hypothetical protein DAI18_02075 [Microvirgula aerodenitrificans]
MTEHADAPSAPEPGMQLPLLLLAVSIMLVTVACPALLADHDGRADHVAALLVFWSMSAGFVRGVGFVPQARLPRWLLGTTASITALLLAVWRLL